MKKVLWLDDDIDLLAPQLQFLNLAGYKVRAVHTIDEAVQTLNEQEYDLLLLDIMMPGGEQKWVGNFEQLDLVL